MDRTERFYKIELLLRTRGSVSFAALVAELEVSPATLKRDLQYLRDRLGAPIAYDAPSNGYRLGGETAPAGPPGCRSAPARSAGPAARPRTPGSPTAPPRPP